MSLLPSKLGLGRTVYSLNEFGENLPKRDRGLENTLWTFCLTECRQKFECLLPSMSSKSESVILIITIKCECKTGPCNYPLTLSHMNRPFEAPTLIHSYRWRNCSSWAIFTFATIFQLYSIIIIILLYKEIFNLFEKIFSKPSAALMLFVRKG